MNRLEQAEKNFFAVTKALSNKDQTLAHNKAWRKPWIFYLQHSPKEAVELLIAEANNIAK